MAVSKTPVPVTANMNIKVKTTTQEVYRYSYIYLNKCDIPKIHFLCIKLKKVIVSEEFFKFNNYLPVLKLQTN